MTRGLQHGRLARAEQVAQPADHLIAPVCCVGAASRGSVPDSTRALAGGGPRTAAALDDVQILETPAGLRVVLAQPDLAANGGSRGRPW